MAKCYLNLGERYCVHYTITAFLRVGLKLSKYEVEEKVNSTWVDDNVSLFKITQNK